MTLNVTDSLNTSYYETDVRMLYYSAVFYKSFYLYIYYFT